MIFKQNKKKADHLFSFCNVVYNKSTIHWRIIKENLLFGRMRRKEQIHNMGKKHRFNEWPIFMVITRQLI